MLGILLLKGVLLYSGPLLSPSWTCSWLGWAATLCGGGLAINIPLIALLNMADFYHTLEVPRNATLEEVRKSYKRLVKVWHPDKNPDNLEEATNKFKQIQLAFRVLSDNNRRAVYDDIIKNENQKSRNADTAASNSNGNNASARGQGKREERSSKDEDTTVNWESVRTEDSKREGRSTRVKHSIFGSVLRKNKYFGSVGDNLEKYQEFGPGRGCMQNKVPSRDVFRRHSILTTLRIGKEQSDRENGKTDQQDGEDDERRKPNQTHPGRETKYRRAGLLSSLLRTGSIDTR